jgi:hypothetical protein
VPKLVCTTCRREVYTVAPLRALFAEERCCGRCGAELIADRRGTSGANVPPQEIPDRRAGAGRTVIRS